MVEIMEIGFKDTTLNEMNLRSNGELFLLNFQLLTQTVVYCCITAWKFLQSNDDFQLDTKHKRHSVRCSLSNQTPPYSSSICLLLFTITCCNCPDRPSSGRCRVSDTYLMMADLDT